MTDQGRKRPERGRAAARFDKMTFAAFAVLLILTTIVVVTIGMSTAADRLGCGLNDIVNVVMAYPRGCH